MTKEEYKDFALRYKGCGACFPMYQTLSRFEKMWFTAIQKDVVALEKENEKLKKRLSVLLSCKNCPDNKGGFICQKEYEDKCLTQKIQYIKELKEENTELEKENAELKDKNKALEQYADLADEKVDEIKGHLTQAKELLKKIEKIVYSGENEIKRLSKIVDILAEAEQFLNSEVEK
jgi:DNA repair exonuclease SbcCD ATPase subunit